MSLMQSPVTSYVFPLTVFQYVAFCVCVCVCFLSCVSHTVRDTMLYHTLFIKKQFKPKAHVFLLYLKYIFSF